MNSEIMMKLRESAKSVLPIAIVVLLLSITLAPIGKMNMILFCFSSIVVIIGLALFSMGADISMMNIGERVGTHLVKTKSFWFMTFVVFVLGMITTIAEPDLKVLASQVPMISDNALIYSVAIGVGIFLVIALLRVLFQIRLSKLLLVFYAIVFAISIFVPNEFLAVAFDSGGVTTGPITVPFIMALGCGLCAMRDDETSQEDTFGFVALASVGPILIVMLLGLFCDVSQITYSAVETVNYGSLHEIFGAFFNSFPHYALEVFFAMLPLLIFFVIYDMVALRIDLLSLSKIVFGLIYTFLGLVIFLTSVNVGFMPVGYLIGSSLAEGWTAVFLIPVGALVGYFIVSAEPAVMVLKKQVEDITEGQITGKVLGIWLGLGIAIAVSIAMIRVITGLSIMYFLIPGYLFSIIMMKFVPNIFTAISFDSGGVASGPMTATFLLPFAMGACEMLGGNIVTDAFGVVAMVAMIPLISIQALGLIYNYKQNKYEKLKSQFEAMLIDGDKIVDFEL